jgi:hypothetical protein
MHVNMHTYISTQIIYIYYIVCVCVYVYYVCVCVCVCVYYVCVCIYIYIYHILYLRIEQLHTLCFIYIFGTHLGVPGRHPVYVHKRNT